FGLTAGIQSLDPAEVATRLDRVAAGNAYVNRPTTGAIVRRQPFGGWKRSSVGPTAKAGGPNYVLTLGRWSGSLDGAAASFATWWADELAVGHDPSGLRAETNVLRYRPYRHGVLLRVGAGVTEREVEVALLAATTVGTAAVVSRHDDEDDAALASRLPGLGVDKVRLLGECSDELRLAGVVVDDSAVVGHGRIELLRWVREQAISETRHRYGNLRA
ncbi:MAG: NAD-dependent aldehyde dehydrogenase, partial [Actinomycetia bacterium]|nr:NAD-dependent aldehyde dehydrogenase [Actinomycetes bacterium]